MTTHVSSAYTSRIYCHRQLVLSCLFRTCILFLDTVRDRARRASLYVYVIYKQSQANEHSNLHSPKQTSISLLISLILKCVNNCFLLLKMSNDSSVCFPATQHGCKLELVKKEKSKAKKGRKTNNRSRKQNCRHETKIAFANIACHRN